MRGGAQGQLMLCADGHLYVVKFQNNAQHVRVLANELVVTRLATQVGLSAPECEVVEVTDWLVAHSPELTIEKSGSSEQCNAGLQFGSRFVGGLMPGQVVDYLPEEQMGAVRNLAEFAGMLVVDKWTGNSNGRQAVFERKQREHKYRAWFIDHGFCFHAGEWNFPDVPLRGVYARNQVYENVTGWESFEPWLHRVEEMQAETLWRIAETVPPVWYGGNLSEMEKLMDQLLARRGKVRGLIEAFRDSDRTPFPKWKRVERIVVPEIMENGTDGDALIEKVAGDKWIM
jgi:hypothetical protein